MKYSLTLLMGAALFLGALPSTASARTVVVLETHRSYHHHHGHYVLRRAHYVWHRGHRVYIPARRVLVYS